MARVDVMGCTSLLLTSHRSGMRGGGSGGAAPKTKLMTAEETTGDLKPAWAHVVCEAYRGPGPLAGGCVKSALVL